MTTLSENEAKELARKHLDSDHLRNPHETTTKADELCDFWMWNPPPFTRKKATYWSGWKELRLTDSEVSDKDIEKLSVDMARYYVERSETDRDYWDALCQIVAKTVDRGGIIDDPYLRTWLSDMLRGERTTPPRKPGNQARKYHERNGCIYFAMQALCDDGPMTQDAAAEWVGSQVNMSKEAILTIYREACKPVS